MALPRGIYYDPSHRRRPYRVRLYVNRHVIHLSYHTSLEDAQEQLRRAQQRQLAIRPPKRKLALHDLEDQLSALRQRYL